MSAHNDGGSAFPGLELNHDGDGYPTEVPVPGMTLRDYFGGQALTGMSPYRLTPKDRDDLAAFCYEMADAMLKARDAHD